MIKEPSVTPGQFDSTGKNYRIGNECELHEVCEAYGISVHDANKVHDALLKLRDELARRTV